RHRPPRRQEDAGRAAGTRRRAPPVRRLPGCRVRLRAADRRLRARHLVARPAGAAGGSAHDPADAHRHGAHGRAVAESGARPHRDAAGAVLDPAVDRLAGLVSRRLLWLSIPLREPFVTALGRIKSRDLIVLRLEERDAVIAHGEAAPFEPYDGVSVAAVAFAMQERVTPALPQVHAADEMAFLDLEGRRLGQPIADPREPTVPVNCTLAGAAPEEVAASAAAAVADGFDCFKLKVGLPDDEARVAAVRDAIGPDALLRLDANAAWTADEARRSIDRLAGYRIEFVEQPCRTLEELAQVRRRTSVRIAADESVQSEDDVVA